MRFVSNVPSFFGPCARQAVIEYTAQGPHEVTPILMCGYGDVGRWVSMDVTQWERDEAVKRWPEFPGMGQDEDRAYRLSGLDTELAQQTEGWTDDERMLVEETLLNHPGNGPRYFQAVREYDRPYPLYDQHRVIKGRRLIDHVKADLEAAYMATGFDPDQAVQYEKSLPDANPRVVEVLQSLTPAEVEPEQVIVA